MLRSFSATQLQSGQKAGLRSGRDELKANYRFLAECEANKANVSTNWYKAIANRIINGSCIEIGISRSVSISILLTVDELVGKNHSIYLTDIVK